MTARESRQLDGLRLCDLYTQRDGVRYRSIGDAADIIAVVKQDGRLFLQANVYPFRCITRPFTGVGLAECKAFVRRWG
jgi:hypothetical protein